MTGTSSTNRNFGLDLVRTMAILLVLFAHSGVSHFLGVKIGTLGVEIFFVLSGFLIGQILIRDFTTEVSAKGVLHFWIRRWFRTLPMYYAVVLIRFAFFDHSLGSKIVVYFLFLQNNFIGIDFMPVSWSLVIEEWFYLIVPVILFVLFRKGLNMKRLTIFLIAFIIFENIMRLVWILYTNRGYAGIIGNPPFRLDSLMVGVLLANIKINYNYIYIKFTEKYFALIAFALCMLLLYSFGSINKIEGLKDQYIWTRTIWFCLISIAIATLIPFLESIQIKQAGFLGKVITWISLYTYSMYLLHPYVYHLMIHSSKYSTMWFGQVLMALTTTFLLSALCYKFYEKPMMDLRDKIKTFKH